MIIGPSDNPIRTNVNFSPGAPGQPLFGGPNESADLASAVSANLGGIPDTPNFSLGSSDGTSVPGQQTGSTTAASLASQGAASVHPWMEAQVDSGNWNPSINNAYGAPPGLEDQYALIRSMASGGGGYEGRVQPKTMDPEVARLLSGHEGLSNFYNPQSVSINQQGMDEVAGGFDGSIDRLQGLSDLDQSYGVNFDANTEVLDVIKDNPELLKFYNDAPQAQDVNLNFPGSSGGGSNLFDGIGDAFSTDYGIGGGSFADQQLASNNLMQGFAGDAMSDMGGDDWSMGIEQNNDGSWEMPDDLLPWGGTDMADIGAATSAATLPAWADGIMAPSDFANIASGAGDSFGDFSTMQDNDFAQSEGEPLVDAMSYLEQYMPDLYPAQT